MATPKQILMQRLREIGGGTKTASVRQSNGLLDLLINAGHAINQHHKTAIGPGGILGSTMPGLGQQPAPATRPMPTRPQPSAAQMKGFADHMSQRPARGLANDDIMAARQISQQANAGGQVPKLDPEGSYERYQYRPRTPAAAMGSPSLAAAAGQSAAPPSATPSGGKGLSIVEALGGGQ